MRSPLASLPIKLAGPVLLVAGLSGCLTLDNQTDGSEGASGDGDGDCGPYPTTDIAECPDLVGEGFCSEGGIHVAEGTPIDWIHEPPHSGDHFPIWAASGESLDPLERGNWVHNLEHGHIVLIYNCPNGCDAELDVLRQVLLARPDLDILLTPDPLLEGSQFAAIAWTWVHAFDVPDLAQLLCFVDQHYDHAPESVH